MRSSTITKTTINNTVKTVADNDDNNEKNVNVFFERKIEEATEGLSPYYSRILFEKISQENALIIAQYIFDLRREINPSDPYRMSIIKILTSLAEFYRYDGNNDTKNKSFKEMTREDLLAYMDGLRKPEVHDPMHKWIGTYNLYLMHFIRFFRWLYYPDIEQSKRPKPKVVENIAKLKRKEQSIYKPTDLWTREDDLLFLKYCPDKRIKCYHTMSRDLSCRPHELLKLKIKDIVFKTNSEGYQYAEVLVNGKTGTRSIPLIDSIPYLKDWIYDHPQGSNTNAPLICGLGKSLGRRLRTEGLRFLYGNTYKREFFPRLLENPNVPLEDKQKIKELLKKPWNPYIRRHTALTEKSKILKEHILRQHAGWSPKSQMHLKYLHFYGNESSESLLEAYGMTSRGQHSLDVLRPKQCPNCNEPNKLDSKFCARCRMVLNYDAYSETLQNEKNKEDKLNIMEERFNAMQSQMQSLITTLGNMDEASKNTFAKHLFDSGIYQKG